MQLCWEQGEGNENFLNLRIRLTWVKFRCFHWAVIGLWLISLILPELTLLSVMWRQEFLPYRSVVKIKINTFKITWWVYSITLGHPLLPLAFLVGCRLLQASQRKFELAIICNYYPFHHLFFFISFWFSL